MTGAAQPEAGLVVLSGCSGGGKSTLLEELRRRGHAVVEEPGRRIVARELAMGGGALPWVDLAAFARRAIEVALADREVAASQRGWVFFDRGVLDAAAALHHAGEPSVPGLTLPGLYHPMVFMTPPWPEIYATDPQRQHGFAEAVAEYERLHAFFPRHGYRLRTLPKLPVQQRADWLLAALTDAAPPSTTSDER